MIPRLSQSSPALHATTSAEHAFDPAKYRSPLQVLIVDEDAGVRQACADVATSLGYTTLVADSVNAARSVFARLSIDLVLLDLRFPASSGRKFLEEIRTLHPQTAIVVMTAFATVHSAVEAMRDGASDYLTKPFVPEELVTVFERSADRRNIDVETRRLRDRLRTGIGMGNLVGRDPAMEKLYRIVSKVATSHHPVLINGEPGTGKELVGRTIHTNGPNASRPFISIDCGSLVPSLLESELFGYAKGAIPGLNRSREGLLVTAGTGTVFLDEISELSLDLQAKLLRALLDKRILPIGATQTVPISARILAATSRNLTDRIASGRFRKDLFFRLNVVNIQVPPLRERKADIPLLASHILEGIIREKGIHYSFADDTLHLMADYDWPGNVRELEHAIERACALSSGPILHIADFPTQLQDHRAHKEQEATLEASRVHQTISTHGVTPIAELEKKAILHSIHQLKGDKLMAARLLGIGKTTLYRKLKEYGIDA